MEATRFPFMHYGVAIDMYRVTYSQTDHYAGLDARAVWWISLEQLLHVLRPSMLFEQIDNHLVWSNRAPTPFVSVWSDAAHAVNFAQRIARNPHTIRNSVSVSRFQLFDYLMINVEEYVYYRGLEMKPYYRHEWLVPDGISFERVLDVAFIYTDENGNVYIEGE